ncbi:MAG TPA: hypothetical protein VKA97_05340 [Pyrinomonadaceae bacterium]|nr:hypothetical protein [Pyrinomonadaceae bacterium]
MILEQATVLFQNFFLEMSFDWFFSLSILEKTDGGRSGGGQAEGGPRAAFFVLQDLHDYQN